MNSPHLATEHHALLCVGDREDVYTHLSSVIAEFALPGSPDVHKRSYDLLTITDARDLKELALMKPVLSETTLIYLRAENIQREAQNALLKLMEEPVSSTRFVLSLPREDILLPTLRSRFMLFFTSLSQKGPYSFPEKIVDEYDAIQEAVKKGDDELLEAMLRAHEASSRIIGGRKQAGGGDRYLSGVLEARKFFSARGASKKMLLEHLSLLRRALS